MTINGVTVSQNAGGIKVQNNDISSLTINGQLVWCYITVQIRVCYSTFSKYTPYGSSTTTYEGYEWVRLELDRPLPYPIHISISRHGTVLASTTWDVNRRVTYTPDISPVYTRTYVTTSVREIDVAFTVNGITKYIHVPSTKYSDYTKYKNYSMNLGL